MYLEQEISSQPDVLRHLLAEEMSNINAIVQAIREFNPAFVWIAARGTSDNAARYAQYVFGSHARLPVGLATPSLHTLYQSPPDLSRALVLGISQSGQSEDVGQVLIDAQKQGALTVSITNNVDSKMAQTAEHHLHLHAGEELSIAATKTYTAQLTTIAMLAAAIVGNDETQQQLTRLPGYLEQIITELDDLILMSWVERYRYIDHFATIGRGYNYCTAFEINLKIKELCYVTGPAYSEADFLHGPIAIIHSGFPVIAIAPKGKTFHKMLELLDNLHEKQSELLVISNDDAAFTHAQNVMRLPADIPEWLSPIAAVVHGQVFALRLALAKGHDVDKPRGLTKVTVTQ